MKKEHMKDLIDIAQDQLERCGGNENLLYVIYCFYSEIFYNARFLKPTYDHIKSAVNCYMNIRKDYENFLLR